MNQEQVIDSNILKFVHLIRIFFAGILLFLHFNMYGQWNLMWMLIWKTSSVCISSWQKNVSYKILQVSCKKVQFLQDSWMQWLPCRILAKFLQDSCKKLCSISRRKILQDSCKNLCSITRILQDLARNKSSVYKLRSDNLCISPKSKHNQPLEVKIDELYTCWTYFVIEYL